MGRRKIRAQARGEWGVGKSFHYWFCPNSSAVVRASESASHHQEFRSGTIPTFGGVVICDDAPDKISSRE